MTIRFLFLNNKIMDLKPVKRQKLKKSPVVEPTLEDVLRRESWETLQEFQARKILTTKLAEIPDFKINTMSSVVIASMMMKKCKFGLEYDENAEKTIDYLIKLLGR